MKKLILYIFLFLFLLLSLFSSGTIDSQDGQLYLAVARYIYYTGQPTAPPYEFNYEGTGKNIHMGTYIGKDGKTYSPTGLGYSLALLPAVAFEDFTYRLYGLKPQLEHFPLESDWPVLFFASFSNAFFGAFLGIIIFLYLIDLGLTKKQSLVMVLVSLFATNLWPYTKHSFAHQMQIFFLVLSFYSIRRYLKTNRIVFLSMSAIAFGVTTIAYNQTFTLSIIPLGLYYILLSKFKLTKEYYWKLARDLAIFILIYLPFFGIFVWYETLRIRVSTPGWTEDFVRQYSFLFGVPLSVFIEGIYGQLLSPGRSIFIYSPILLLILFFHHKIKSIVKPELLVFLSLSVIYLIFFASLYVIEDPKYGARGLWDGELSWGPRYLLPLIPFGMLTVGVIYKSLSKMQKVFVFLPVVLVGFYINLLGILLPYQLKLHDLQPELFINGHKYTSFSYSDLFPRYTPVLSMSKELAHHLKSLPETLNHGKYNFRLYDGFSFPFLTDNQKWRVIDGKGFIEFDNPRRDIREIALAITNYQLKESSQSAMELKISINGENLNGTELAAGEKRVILISVEKPLKDKGNQLALEAKFKEAKVAEEKSQIAGLVAVWIDKTPVNLQSLDYPFGSKLGKPLNREGYQNYGSENPWKTWDVRTQIYERTFDVWWLKPLYYWDLPKIPFLLLFLCNVFCLIYFGLKAYSWVFKSDAKSRS